MSLQPTRKSQKGHHGKKGSTVYLHAGIWFDKRTAEIHIAGPKESRFHSTVSDNPESKRYHPNLYKKLKEILLREGCW